MAEIVYVLTNSGMPGLVKIGRTSKPLEERMQGLYTPGVPFPFECFYAAIVDDSTKIEKAIHDIFSDKRVETNREFFLVEPNRVRKAIELVAIEDITPKIDVALSKEDSQALIDNERRQTFRFSLAKVPVGSELRFIRDESKICRVIDDKYVDFEGQTMSLSGAALFLLKKMGYKSPQVQGPLYWSYEGESLVERRRRFEEEDLA